MIQEYCEDEENVLKCLWKHRLQQDFDEKCLKVVHKRMIAKGEGVLFVIFMKLSNVPSPPPHCATDYFRYHWLLKYTTLCVYQTSKNEKKGLELTLKEIS